MEIIRQIDYKTMPWKNGQGVTREVYCSSIDNTMAWRLSLATVKADGPFSKFAGLERILTVIEGQGLRLIGPDTDITALQFQPIKFSGNTDIMCYCLDGPIEDFNLIYDPALVTGDVQIVTKLTSPNLICKENTTLVVHLLKGRISFEGDVSLNAGDTCVLRNGSSDILDSEDLQCAIVSLTHR